MLDLLLTLLVTFVLVFGFVKPVVADSRYVGSGSMIPTLKVGHGTLQKDRVLINKLAYDFGEPRRGDIALFESVEGGEDDLIKRVIAVEEDTVQIRHGVLYVNGKRRAEPYLTLSYDSRYFGPVPEEKLIGEAVLRYWPLDRVGLV